MAIPTNIKTTAVRRMLLKAGFELARGRGAHEVYRLGRLWFRLPAGHRNIGLNEWKTAQAVIAAAQADTHEATAA